MKKMFVVLEFLKEHGPISSPQLGEKMGMSREAARSHINYLREQMPKSVYIHSWSPSLGFSKGRSGPLWAVGDAEDAPQPLVRIRPKKSPLGALDDDGYEVHLRNELMKRAMEIKPFRHWQDVAFFGEVKSGLSTNTLEADGYGKGKFAPSRPEVICEGVA